MEKCDLFLVDDYSCLTILLLFHVHVYVCVSLPWEFLSLTQNMSAVWSFGNVQMDRMTLNIGRIHEWCLTSL